MAKELEIGYSDTGYIPETGDNVGRLDEMARKEAEEERLEKAWAKKFGYEYSEDESQGFLERRNTCDRM